MPNCTSDDLHPGHSRCDRIGQLHPALQSREAGYVAVESNDLAVNHEVVEHLRADGVCDLGIRGIEGFAVPGEELDAVSVAEREAAFAIKLQLKD